MAGDLRSGDRSSCRSYPTYPTAPINDPTPSGHRFREGVAKCFARCHNRGSADLVRLAEVAMRPYPQILPSMPVTDTIPLP